MARSGMDHGHGGKGKKRTSGRGCSERDTCAAPAPVGPRGSRWWAITQLQRSYPPTAPACQHERGMGSPYPVSIAPANRSHMGGYA